MSTVEERFAVNFYKSPKNHIEMLDKLVDDGYLKRSQNKFYPELFIYNYTQQTVFERYWNTYTMASRGLVIDKEEKKIVALPFAKFFNLNEMQGTELEHLSSYDPTLEFEEFDKLDGSLGVGFVHKNTLIWCTRGDFESDQAKFANKYMRDMFTESHLQQLAFEYDGMTIMAEIIYPQNRIVVDYGNKKELVILGMIRNSNGKEMSYYDLISECKNIELPVVTKYQGLYIEDLLEERETWDKNTEGRVIKFSDGKRLKIKGAEYLRVHKLRYGFSRKMQVELWREGKLGEYLGELEEEFRPEVELLKSKLDALYHSLDLQVINYYEEVKNMKRGDIAFYLKDKNVQKTIMTCVFNTLDGKPYDEKIKKYIYRNYRDILGIGE